MYIVIWRYRVDPAQAAKFEKAYGPKGEWARFFAASKDYLGTELLAETRLGAFGLAGGKKVPQAWPPK